MKLYLILPLFIAILPSCAWFPPRSDSTIQTTLRKEGIVPFSLPTGNPTNPKDWNKFGPGAVLDVKDGVSRGNFHSSMNTFWADGGTSVTEAMNPQQHASLKFPDKINLSRGRNGNFGGSMIAQEAAIIAANAGFQDVSKVQVVLAGVSRSQPFSVDAITKRAAAAPLPKGTSRVLAPVFANDISYTFESASSDSGYGSLTVSPSAQAKLQAKGYKVTNNTLVSTGPVFLGFYPCP